MNLLCVSGTRPEYLKIKPVAEAARAAGLFGVKWLHTGQHTDTADFSACDFSIRLRDLKHARVSRLNSLFSQITARAGRFMEGFDAVMVQGDTASAAAAALCAFNLKIPVIHLEAGLRTRCTGDPFPEEGCRQMIARLASMHLCPTEGAKENLEREGAGGSIHVTGNTALDALKGITPSLKPVVPVTLHRTETLAAAERWMEALDQTAAEHPFLCFILCAHPNPALQRAAAPLKCVTVSPALPHAEFTALLSSCTLAVSDSGGVQEEAAFLGKRVVVCRRSTERPEGIRSGHLFLCPSPELLGARVRDCLLPEARPPGPCPYGDGRSAPRIVTLVEGFFKKQGVSDPRSRPL